MDKQISKSNLSLEIYPCFDADATVYNLFKDYIVSKKAVFPDCCFDFSTTANLYNISNTMQACHIHNVLRMMIFTYRFFTQIWPEIENTDLERQFKKMKMTSCYRSKRLNLRVGGSKNSLHLEGLAFDLWAPADCRDILDFLFLKFSDCIKSGELETKRLSATFGAPFVYPYEVILYPESKNVLHLGYTYINPNTIV